VDVLHYVELNKRAAAGRPDLSRASEVGIDLERAGRSAYYLQIDRGYCSTSVDYLEWRLPQLRSSSIGTRT